jgi:3-deoxy-D-manno-octulosonic-acid transferase
VDAACYLPAERRAEMAAFLDRIDPDCVLIMRYDLWPAFLMGLADRGVPAVLACGVLRADSGRFNPLLRGFFAWMYGMLAHAFVVEPDDAEAFRRLVPRLATEVCGDTRYDRVAERVAAQADLGPLSRGSLLGPESGAAAPLIVVAGSTWPADERVLRPLADDPRFRLIIVPHEPTADHVAALLAEFPGSIAASALPAAGPAGPPDSSRATVVVDRTGLLALLYRVADIAYVGGAFGEGVHSVLEPAAYGLPVIAGPGLARSRDAVALHRSGALAVVRTGPELHAEAGRLYDDPAERARRACVARAFVAGRVGATERIVAALHGRLAAPRAQGAGQGA